MAVCIYYVVHDDFDRWAVRLNQAVTPMQCMNRTDAVITARRYAARDYHNGHAAQVQVQTEMGFELDWCAGGPVEPGSPTQ